MFVTATPPDPPPHRARPDWIQKTPLIGGQNGDPPPESAADAAPPPLPTPPPDPSISLPSLNPDSPSTPNNN